jgi:hypothetical protein
LTPTEPTWWPDDSYGLIFLPRFVEKIGFHVFADWTGTEAPTELQVVLLPELAAANMYHRIYADKLLHKHRPDLTPWPYLDFASGSGNHKHWPIAQQLAEREYNEAAPALLRLRSVRDEIRRHSLTKKLVLRIHKIPGGPWKEFDPAWWNGNRANDLFDSGTIDPEYPFGGRPPWKGDNDHRIFAPCEGVDQIVVCLKAPPEAEPQLSRSAIEVDSAELDPAAAQAQSTLGQSETPPPAPAADAAPKPIEKEPASGDKKTEKTAKDFEYAKDFVPWAVTHYPRDTVGVPDYPEYLRKLAGNRWSKKTIQNELSKLK